MPRPLAAAIVALVSDAVALVVTAMLLDRMSLSIWALLFAVLLFTGLDAIFEPFIRNATARSAPAIEGLSALFSTFVSLLITAALSAGLRISGVTTWLLATLMVWLIGLAARRLLPLVIFTEVLRRREPSE